MEFPKRKDYPTLTGYKIAIREFIFKLPAPSKDLERKISEYSTIEKIVDQLIGCEYENEAGYLINNIAFISLMRMA